MKRILAILLTLVMAFGLFTGCSNDSDAQNSTSPSGEASETSANDDSDKISVVSTIFPGYDFSRAVIGDLENVELTMLLSPGSESHSYEPSPQDIITIQNCDVFIYVGGESDTWVDGILSSMDTSNIKIISMMDLVETVEEEIVEGMEDEHDHDHDSGSFEDSEVEDRELSDWYGEWQSVYPYLLDGTLDEVMEHKAEESEDMTAEDYHDYYETGYKTDVSKIVIEDNTLEYTKDDGTTVKAEYEYAGYEILTYESGSKGVRYQFKAVGETNGAPEYIQFSDHEIGPTEAEHFHLFWGDESFETLLGELENWPTYFPSNLSGDEIVEEMIGHDHSEEDEEAEYDEHVWTSPINAIAITESISDTLSAIDTANADTFKSNCAEYVTSLEKLDTEFKEIVANSARKTFIFGDRFPLRYFADEYGLDYYAAFSGCSTETEASAQTVAFLIDKVEEENIPVVFYIELSNEKMADTICEFTGAEKLLFHSCHNVTKDDFESGVTYIDLMTNNVTALKQALS